ncbi:MAG: SDR family oxidoreductase [Rhodospirillaceae bacterium]|nr:SDR family oxidoreductase [Rhodospirillaceae bacterium]
MTASQTIAVTGATGQLGRLVIAALLARTPTPRIIALARNPAAAQDLAERGVAVRAADYEDSAAVAAALSGVDKVLLISSSAVGRRAAHHRSVIDAAAAAGVTLLAYTSILHADTNPMVLASEHRETEAQLLASGVPHVLLRNGWYTENFTASAWPAIAHGAVLGSSGDGRISSAARADFAAAAAAVLTSGEDQAGRCYELAGDSAYTLGDYAAELARQSGKPVVYRDLPEADFAAALEGMGLPPALAKALADSSAHTKAGALFDDGGDLRRLIGRPTTPMAETVAAALAAAG